MNTIAEHYELLAAALQDAADAHHITGLQIRFEGHVPVIEGADDNMAARLFGEAMLILSRTRQALGHSMLIGMWHIYRNGYIREIAEYDTKDFVEWALNEIGVEEDDKYAAKIAYIVARILQDVHFNEMESTPYVDGFGDITVARILNTAGLMKKLGTISATYESADRDGRADLLYSLLNDTSRKVQQKTAEVRDGVVKVRIVIPYKVWQTGGKTTITLEDLDEDQYRLFETLVSGNAEVTYATGGWLAEEPSFVNPFFLEKMEAHES